ncbi:transmembrane protein 252 [Erythrolamprus reginae]|uniref:transmembrane protein 252 n=1 Tax=Erythrolamprus reginae TaxID=121349 RepID=UPI00396C970A
MSKNLFSFVRLFVLLLGLVTVCLGAFCISTSVSACTCNSLPLAYFLLPLGFFLLIAGISWSTYHEASKHNSLFHSIIQGIPRLQESHITTIDRPDFYPPSYEDSTALGKQTFSPPACSLEPKSYAYNIPPPLYTESRFEFIEETDAEGQQPPSYEASVQQRATLNDATFGEASHTPQP